MSDTTDPRRGDTDDSDPIPSKSGRDSEVTILMAVFNGARFLADQLDSLARQTQPWKLIAADDGSNDESREILDRFATKNIARVAVTEGPGLGAAANFRGLLAALPAGTRFAALADQDDVWQPDKLRRAVAALADIPEEVPGLYCSRVTICTAALRPLGLSRPAPLPSFRHALVQNMVQGNTVVLNRAAIELVAQVEPLTGTVVMHDWWLYQLVMGVGGRLVHDPRPSLLYRQHDENVVGANDGWIARATSLRRMLGGHHRKWSRANLVAMSQVRPMLTDENRQLLDLFAQLQGGTAAARLLALRRGRFYRQGALSQAALWMAAALGRV